MAKISLAKRLLTAGLAAALLLCSASTLALNGIRANALTNGFAVAKVNTNLTETTAEGNKTVKVTNTAPSDVYVRVRILVSGIAPEKVHRVSVLPPAEQMEEGVVYLLLNDGSAWQHAPDATGAEDFYYYLACLPGTARAPEEAARTTAQPLLYGVYPSGALPEAFAVLVYHESVLAQNSTLGSAAAIEAAFAAAG